jgi:all-trans-retinol 13,14-reductase
LQDELERHVPAVRGQIDYTELSTPLTTRHFANFPQGEIYGLSAVPARFRLPSLGARTPIPDLYLSGADAAAPGVTGALYGGIIAASLILGRNLKPTPSRSKRHILLPDSRRFAAPGSAIPWAGTDQRGADQRTFQ